MFLKITLKSCKIKINLYYNYNKLNGNCQLYSILSGHTVNKRNRCRFTLYCITYWVD